MQAYFISTPTSFSQTQAILKQASQRLLANFKMCHICKRRRQHLKQTQDSRNAVCYGKHLSAGLDWRSCLRVKENKHLHWTGLSVAPCKSLTSACKRNLLTTMILFAFPWDQTLGLRLQLMSIHSWEKETFHIRPTYSIKLSVYTHEPNLFGQTSLWHEHLSIMALNNCSNKLNTNFC